MANLVGLASYSNTCGRFEPETQFGRLSLLFIGDGFWGANSETGHIDYSLDLSLKYIISQATLSHGYVLPVID
jgi:hypothetical protein